MERTQEKGMTTPHRVILELRHPLLGETMTTRLHMTKWPTTQEQVMTLSLVSPQVCQTGRSCQNDYVFAADNRM
jgi:hypothetical protein